MKLVLIGKHTIEQLEKWAVELFTDIKNSDVVVPDLGSPAPYDNKNLAHIYRFVPVKDKDIMSFYWFLPYTQPEYKTQPLKYLSHLFGHEGYGSLLSYLISEGLALELSCGFDHELWSFDNFYIDVTLTAKGMEN
jgi:secreted Zn-dependent insulinase-like peptidase